MAWSTTTSTGEEPAGGPAAAPACWDCEDGSSVPSSRRSCRAAIRSTAATYRRCVRRGRRAGWDLIFAAPKSLSLLAATVSERGESIVEAHQRAVGEAIGHMERRHLTIRRSGAPDGRVPALGCVAAAFDHRTSAAAEPHLHSHLILANLGQLPGGAWGAISSGWWVSRHALAAIYQLGLRHHLDAAGWRLDWRLRPDGLPDLAAVPRAAVRATSTQRKATVALGRFEGRRRATPQPWRARAADAGFEPGQGAPWPRHPRSANVALEAPELNAAVAARLAATRSAFRESDVIVALGGLSSGRGSRCRGRSVGLPVLLPCDRR